MRNTRRIADIISAAYGRRYRLIKPRRHESLDDHYFSFAMSGFFERAKEFIRRHPFLLLIGGVCIIKVFLAYHYYNILVSQESNMMASYSNMYVVLQRRNDVGRNLITAIHYYTEYEERVYNEIVRVRSNHPKNEATKESLIEGASQNPTPDEKSAAVAALTKGLSTGAGIMPPLTKLMAVAEQYPDLKSETNFSLLMAAMVELEKDLAVQRIKFNADANAYTTTLRQFPSLIFAWEFGFKNFPYFDASQEAKEFKIQAQKY